MDTLVNFIVAHAHLAHWFIFAAIIIAGFNIPISADAIIIISALIASTVIPENTVALFLSVFLGCYFSAWIAYWMGRYLGPKFYQFKWFAKFLPPERLAQIKTFYENHGMLTLLIGRFIPFGVRNAIFMTTGLSRMSFLLFVVRDLFACLIWSGCMFSIFYKLGQNYQVLYKYVKMFNLLIFSIFIVAVIGFLWYKKRKKTARKSQNLSQ